MFKSYELVLCDMSWVSVITYRRIVRATGENQFTLLSPDFGISGAVAFPQNFSLNGEVSSRVACRKIRLNERRVWAAKIANCIDKITADINLPVRPSYLVDHFPRSRHQRFPQLAISRGPSQNRRSLNRSFADGRVTCDRAIVRRKFSDEFIEVPIPDYQTLMLPLLKFAAEGESRIPDLEERVANDFGLTSIERNMLLPSGRQKILHNRMHWAKFYLTKAGLVEAPRRGRFVATSDGRALLSRKPKSIDVDLLQQYSSFREFYKGANGAPSASINVNPSIPIASISTITPEEQIEGAYAAMQLALKTDLLQRILQSTPRFFEEVIVNLLVSMGYGGSRRNAAQQLGRSGDGGVDGVINEDRLGLDRVYVQAKRYAVSSSIGRPDVQGFVGSLVGLGATKGVFVTTSSFSSQAVEFVRHLSQRVVLIDGQNLADLMIEHNVGVRSARIVEFKRIDEDFFSEED